MYLKWQPIILDQELLFQSFDNTFADVAKGSDIIGIDFDPYGCHMRLHFFIAYVRFSVKCVLHAPQYDKNSKKSSSYSAFGWGEPRLPVVLPVHSAISGRTAVFMREPCSPGVATDEGIRPGTISSGPSVTAGLLWPADFTGYRAEPVYIRRSMHMPPRYEAVRDLLPVFFDLPWTQTSIDTII
jgi:hypothetical protein